MIEEYFGLSVTPFRLGTDPRFYFESDRHNKITAYLQYGLQQAEGFVVITGRAGVGKSMVVNQFLTQIEDTDVIPIVIPTSYVAKGEVIYHILSALHIEPAGKGYAAAHEALESYLSDQRGFGHQAIIIVDEAQNLSRDVLEELRILTNMSCEGVPLLQVLLAGQTELRQTIEADDLEQLRQRVIASSHLEALSAEETLLYIDHRMDVAGWQDPYSAFSNTAMELIYQETQGVPRRINTFCTRLLLHAALEGKEFVDSDAVKEVRDDLRKERQVSSSDEPVPPSVKAPMTVVEEKLETVELQEDVSEVFLHTNDSQEETDPSSEELVDLSHLDNDAHSMHAFENLSSTLKNDDHPTPRSEQDNTQVQTVFSDETDGVVVPFAAPREAAPAKVPRKLPEDNEKVQDNNRLQRILSNVYEQPQASGIYTTNVGESTLGRGHTSVAMPPMKHVNTLGENIMADEDKNVIDKNEVPPEVEEITNSLAAFIAETQDGFLDISAKLSDLKASAENLQQNRKARHAVLSDGLLEVNDLLQGFFDNKD